ncbi:MAG: transporter substrate-binding domain-containing protein [Lachnospiraceae bacterium]|jgi:signal transduction histidine kinase/CheY-like chemotaxis protein/membrane-bound lytic murein transglycosylase MltF|nr:transporter substrate-binding domain-containing protein [Lachnospiraceae bacterium]
MIKNIHLQKNRHWLKKFIASLLVFALLAALFPAYPVGAADRENQTVRIGYYYDSDYFYKNDQGDYCGYNVEYFYEISKYTNWQYQYVDFSSFEDAYAALEKGEIDLLPSLFYTEERANTLLLSDYDMGSVYVTIIVPQKNTSIAYNDYAALEGKKVGILSDSVDGEKYRGWAEEQGLHTEIISMSTTEELLKALDEGSLDAVAISYLGSSSTYRIIKEFSPMKMYIGMPKDHTALMKELNSALEEITIETPDFANDLYSRYYIANQQQAPVFTADEQNYIAGSKTLSVAVLNSNAPFSYSDKNGSMTGATIDYFSRISELSGLQFSFKGYDTQDEIISAVKNGEADIAGAAVYDAVDATANNILLTNSYISMALTQVTLKGNDQIRTMAVPSYLTSVIQNNFKDADMTVRTYPTATECMKALTNGSVEGAVLNTYSANCYMNNSRAGEYNVTALNGLSYRLAAGLSASSDRTLLSVLNRCIRYSNVTTMNQLIVKYSQADTSSFQATLNRIPVALLYIFAAAMCCFVIILIVLLLTIRRRQKEKETLSKQQAAVTYRSMELAAAEKFSAESNQFFSNVSHDMRTPLNAVIGFAGLAEKENSIEKKNEYLSKIESSGKLLLDLINDTLTISKTRNHNFELHPEPVRSRELFDSIIAPIHAAASKKNITFTVDSDSAADRVILADRLNVQKIFLNLLSNAVKYTPEGGHVRLRIYNEPSADGSPDSLFTVSDDGIGISPEFLPHIYEPFSQEKRHGYESVGTGLGLSIVKEMVEKMGGSIDVKSEPGKGTTFTVRLHFEEAEKAASFAAKNINPSVNLQGRKVLVCEDNALNREIAMALLKKKDMDVVCAEDGQAGVNVFAESAENEYDAILMDIRMPVMDGIEATKAIRRLERPDAETIPIIAMTADAYEDDVKRCLDAGMNGHMAKPIDPDTLYRTLAEAVS